MIGKTSHPQYQLQEGSVLQCLTVGPSVMGSYASVLPGQNIQL